MHPRTPGTHHVPVAPAMQGLVTKSEGRRMSQFWPVLWGPWDETVLEARLALELNQLETTQHHTAATS